MTAIIKGSSSGEEGNDPEILLAGEGSGRHKRTVPKSKVKMRMRIGFKRESPLLCTYRQKKV
jgi:hypothetical protein